MGGALRDKRGSGGDSQGPMALERVRAGPAVAPPTGGEARRGRGWARRGKCDCDHSPHFRASGKGMLAREKARRAQTFLNANPDAPFEASLPKASSVALLHDAVCVVPLAPSTSERCKFQNI